MSFHDDAKLHEAGTLLKSARRLDPEDFFVLATATAYGFRRADESLWRPAVNDLKRLAPDDMMTHYWSAIAAASDGNFELAESEIRRAKELGLSVEETNRILQLLQARPFDPLSWLWKIGVIAFVWIAGLVMLLFAGFILSKTTLATIEATQRNTILVVGNRERWLRRIYRSVIAITSIYYYLSIPMVITLVLLIGGVALYGFLALGHIPIKLFLLIAIGVLYSVYVMVRSLLIKPPDSEPGKSLPESEAPLLWATVREVAQRVGTRPVDTIYLTPGTEIAVMERGSLLEKVRDAAKRCLILGLGVMEGMSRRQLCAILAHEYGHFAHKDTAGGNMAWQVNHSIQQAAWGLALNGLAKWYNPAWLFINGFNHIFLRVTLGASRLQEILADRYAALSYGAKAFAGGLAHVIKRSIEFNFTATAELKKALAEKRQPANLYALTVLPRGDEQAALDNQFKQAMSRPMSEYDSHPPANQRIEWVHRLKTEDVKSEADSAAWELLPQRAVLEEAETRRLYEIVLANN
jgi:Zn-dependent protease with chaperone function